MLNKLCKYVKTILLLNIFVFGSGYLKAEGLVDVVNLAFTNNYEYKSSIEKYNAQYAYKNLATSYLLPNIDLAATVAVQNSKQQYSDKNIAGASNTLEPYGFSVTLTQPLLNVEAWSYYSQSKLMAEQAKIVLDRDKNSIIVKAVQYYIEVLIAQEKISYLSIQKEVLENQIKEIEKKIRLGSARKIDLDEINATYSTLLYNEIVAKNNLQSKQEQLNLYLHKDISNYKYIKEDISNIYLDNSTLEDWQNLALKSNLDIASNKVALLISSEEVIRNKAGYYPSISLVGKYTYDGSQDPSQNKAPYSTQGAYVGLSLNMNLFAGGKTQQTNKQLQSTQKQNEYSLKELENQIKNLTSQYYLNVYNGLSQISALEQVKNSSENFLKFYEQQYLVGNKTIKDVLDYNQKYFESLTNLSEAKYNFLLSILTLKSISGVITTEDIINLDNYLQYDPVVSQ